jgi:hypothetical protein
MDSKTQRGNLRGCVNTPPVVSWWSFAAASFGASDFACFSTWEVWMSQSASFQSVREMSLGGQALTRAAPASVPCDVRDVRKASKNPSHRDGINSGSSLYDPLR